MDAWGERYFESEHRRAGVSRAGETGEDRGRPDETLPYRERPFAGLLAWSCRPVPGNRKGPQPCLSLYQQRQLGRRRIERNRRAWPGRHWRLGG